MATYASLKELASYLTTGYWRDNNSAPHHFANNTIGYNFGNLNAAERTLARTAMDAWEDVAAINFVPVPATSAQITFNHNGNMVAHTISVGQHATIEISSDWITTYGDDVYSYGHQTYIHEIGHALGLGHQGPYDGSATYGVDNKFSNDSWRMSVMSYFNQAEAHSADKSNYVITPQQADIYAIQTLYGAANTRTGDTTYGFNSTAGALYDFAQYTTNHPSGMTCPSFTIYDSGGNDTLDCSGFNVWQFIELQPGRSSSIGGMGVNVTIADNPLRTTVIENAIGGSGIDYIYGNKYGNHLSGGKGNDWLDSGQNSDASLGVDVLDGGEGDDWLVGNSARDTMQGGLNSDTISYTFSPNNVYVDLTVGRGRGAHAEGDTYLSIENVLGSYHHDTIIGDSNANRLDGASGNDTLIGNGGNDTLIGGRNPDEMYGGAGIDTVSYENALSRVGVDLFVAYNNAGDAYGDTLSGIENVRGSGYHDTIKGSTSNNVIWALQGNDYIDGRGGDDTVVIEGLRANYTVDRIGLNVRLTDMRPATANQGIDEIHEVEFVRFNDGLFATDQLFARPFTTAGDTIAISSKGGSYNALGGNDVLKYSGGMLTIDGSAGSDTLDFSGFESAVQINLTSDGIEGRTMDRLSLTGGTWRDIVDITSVENLIGSAGADDLRGTNDANRLVGGDGSDVLVGRGSSDVIYGSSNNDRLYGDGGDDFLKGGSGNDLINAGSGHDRLYGESGNDSLKGSTGSDYINGGSGHDRIYGETSNDNLNGSTGNDYINGGSGNDRIYGESGNDNLRGSTGNDYISSSSGNDRIYGESGNDTMSGGLGRDTISGGAGRDVIVFDSKLGSGNIDTLVGFSVADDSIRLDNAAFRALHTGRLSAESFHIGSTAADTNDHVIYNATTGALIYDSNGNHAGGAIQFATLSKGLALTHSDFLVI